VGKGAGFVIGKAFLKRAARAEAAVAQGEHRFHVVLRLRLK
jgi:hypothetical protein